MDIRQIAALKYGPRIAARIAGGKVIADGNFVSKGTEQTPLPDASLLQLPRGEEQRDTDPRVVAGLTPDPATKDEEEPEPVGRMMHDFVQTMDAILREVSRRGGLKGLRASVRRKPVTTTGIRSADAARLKERDAAKRSDNEWVAAARERDEAMNIPYTFYPTYFDKALGFYRPVRP
jgi:hypothetical protein